METYKLGVSSRFSRIEDPKGEMQIIGKPILGKIKQRHLTLKSKIQGVTQMQRRCIPCSGDTERRESK